MFDNKRCVKLSWLDKKCKSLRTREEQKLCLNFGSALQDIIADLDEKGYIRSELKTSKEKK